MGEDHHQQSEHKDNEDNVKHAKNNYFYNGYLLAIFASFSFRLFSLLLLLFVYVEKVSDEVRVNWKGSCHDNASV